MEDEQKEKLVEVLLQRYVGEVSDLEYFRKETEKLVDDLFSEKEQVGVLSVKRTTALRKMIGRFDYGEWQGAKEIARSLKITYQAACQIMLSLNEDIRFMVYTIPSRKKSPLTKMSSILDKETQEKARKITIWDIGLGLKTIQALRREDVITMLDLSCYGIGDFCLGEVGRYKILSEAHRLGFSFMEELSLEERKTIVSSSPKEVVDQSSVSWIMSLEDIYWYGILRSLKNLATLRERKMKGMNLPSKFEKTALAIGIDLGTPKSEVYNMRKEELLSQYRALTSELATLKRKEEELNRKIEAILTEIDLSSTSEIKEKTYEK